MKILGINDTHDAGAALVIDGKIISAINEERLNRIKLTWGMPSLSIKKLLELNNLSPKDIDYITVGTKYGKYREKATTHKEIDNDSDMKRNRYFMSFLPKSFGWFFKTSLWRPVFNIMLEIIYKDRQIKLKKWFRKRGFTCPIKFIDHHLSHAASSYYTGGKPTALIFTSDGAGDTLSGTVYAGKNGKLRKIKSINEYNSIAMFYSYVTEICGFIPMKHEGKITGLAAHGKPIYYKKFKKWISYRNGGIFNDSGRKHASARELIIKECPNFKKEDLAASVQKLVETEMPKLINYWVRKTGIHDVVLAGGLFANVRLNQAINELPSVNSIFIHPHMGDGGIALGSALYLSNNLHPRMPYYTEDVFFGPEFSDNEIESALKKYKLKYKKHKNSAKEVAQLLAKGKVVARFDGKMEYGPRALGSRSILYQATDPTVNDWLNKKLRRTEWMPFAPLTLEEDLEKYYKNIQGGKQAAKFMTVTFHCQEVLHKKSPAIVHLDGTARPQTINEKQNKVYYNILKEYKKLTKLPVIINTSFNMHEEPIVCTPEDAIRAFLLGHLDYLSIGNFLVKFEDNKTKKTNNL